LTAKPLTARGSGAYRYSEAAPKGERKWEPDKTERSRAPAPAFSIALFVFFPVSSLRASRLSPALLASHRRCRRGLVPIVWSGIHNRGSPSPRAWSSLRPPIHPLRVRLMAPAKHMRNCQYYPPLAREAYGHFPVVFVLVSICPVLGCSRLTEPFFSLL
jgi:hypothetical protein